MANSAAIQQPVAPGHVLRLPGFRRMLAVRLSGQFADGVFQASLAGTVLFNPERQAHAADIASGFAVLLLPYSVLGPFCGVLLDRWWRQRVLTYANLLRAFLVCLVSIVIGFGVSGWLLYLSALIVISINRFVLSALSTCLPHVVDLPRLMTANAISTTSGAIATAMGGAAAIGLRMAANGGNRGYAVIAVGSAVFYLVSGLRARAFATTELGPDEETRSKIESVRSIARGLRAGARHVASHPSVVRALTVIGLHRFAYGVTAISLLLLYRNYFQPVGPLRSGLSGLGQVVAAIAIGGGLAAVLTPIAVARLGYTRWSGAMLITAGLAEWIFGLPHKIQLVLPAALILGFVAQGVKICVDTMVAQRIADDFRGRVFTLYDTLFNVVFVAAGVLTAIALPESGKSGVAVVLTGILWSLLGIGYLCARDDVALHLGADATEEITGQSEENRHHS